MRHAALIGAALGVAGLTAWLPAAVAQEADALRLSEARLDAAWATNAVGTRTQSLAIIDLHAGGRVQLRCLGRGCPGATPWSIVPQDAGTLRRADLARRLRGRLLAPGARVRVTITEPRRFGRLVRFTMRAGDEPRMQERCVRPGGRISRSCRH